MVEQDFHARQENLYPSSSLGWGYLFYLCADCGVNPVFEGYDYCRDCLIGVID